jgi:membrane fusion protein, heavy metal efflux system
MPARVPLLTGACAAAALAAAGPCAHAATAAGTAAPPVLELSEVQVKALTLSAAETRAFPLEITAVGSVSFEEDPATVQAQATLIGAAASLELAVRELRRVEGLGEGNGIAQKELEQARASEQTARAALRAARDALRALGQSDADIGHLVGSGAIPAPGAGTWVLANVAESDSVGVHPGQAVTVHVMALPQRSFQGRVARVYAAVDPSTHRVAVRATLSDPAGELRAGMLADVTIRLREPLRAAAVPENGAVREADGSTSVWVTLDRRHFTQRSVRTGERSGGWVQILAGVRAGELVVADGAVFLSNMLQAPPGD